MGTVSHNPAGTAGGRHSTYPLWIGLLVMLFMAVSCATAPEPALRHPSPSASHKDLSGVPQSDTESRLRAEYRRWKGTEHQMGGTSQSGVDCSGFVQAVCRNLFQISLPRTTGAQVRQGSPVQRSELQAGDLIFFTPPEYPRHVGICLNRNEFVHASKTNGVTISQLGPPYWDKHYWTARRVLPPAP